MPKNKKNSIKRSFICPLCGGDHPKAEHHLHNTSRAIRTLDGEVVDYADSGWTDGEWTAIIGAMKRYRAPEPQSTGDKTRDAILAAQTPKGGYTRRQLAEWGVPWPPPKGWKKRLLRQGLPSR